MRERETAVHQLRAFVAVVESGRMTTAARTCGVAQSTISEALAALERALGAQVLVRGRQNGEAQLTAAGQALLPHARAVLDAVDRAHLAVAEATNRARTQLEIIANDSVSTYLLPPALAQLRGSWPNTRFSVTIGTCPNVRNGVSDGTFDVGLLLEQQGNALAAGDRYVLGPDISLLVFAKPSHPVVQRPLAGRVRRIDAADYPVFMSDATGDFFTLVHQFFNADRAGAFTLEATGTVESVKRAVMGDTRALGLLPAYAVTEELRLGTFVAVELRPAPPRMRLVGLVSSSRARHPAVDELLGAIEHACAPDALKRVG